MNPWHDPNDGKFTSGPAGSIAVLQDLVEFACHSAACRPPTSGGTGGSRPGGSTHTGPLGGPDSAGAAYRAAGVATTSDEHLALLFPGRSMEHKKVNPDGTFSIEGLDENGNFTKFSDSTEKKLAARWASIGNDDAEYEANFVIAGKLAMGIDPKTNRVVDEAQAAEGLHDSKWYTVANADCKAITRDTGIPEDNVIAATTTLSAGRLWSGTKNGNIETARRLAELTRDNPEIELDQGHLDFIAWRGAKSVKEVGRLGLTNFPMNEPGKVRFNDLDSASAVEAVYAINAMRGYKSFPEWAAASTKDGVIGGKTPRLHDKIDPPFPFFTSKGTQQVKQAVSVLRGDVTPREAISGPKYSSFYSNIKRPDVDYSSTNDTWHYRIMAGNNSLHHKGRVGTVQDLTLAHTKDGKIALDDDDAGAPKGKKEKKTPAFATTQDIFQSSVSAKQDNLDSGDGMFRDTTRLARTALNQLKRDAPDQFGNMKLHEFQALIWVYYGGGKVSKAARMKRWDGALAEMKEMGR